MAQGICSVGGCERPRLARGWCSAHYQRWLRWGDPEAPARWSKRDPVCTVEGCGRPHRRHGFCEMHDARFEKHGDPLVVKHGGDQKNDPNAAAKRCTKCGQSKPLDEFTAWARRNDGRRATCKGCGRTSERLRRFGGSPEALAYADHVLCNDPCAYCGERPAEIDHIEPTARGGSKGDPMNLTAACHRCNASKGRQSLLAWLLRRNA